MFRERREAASQRLPLTRELPLAARGARGRQLPLRAARSATASSRWRRRASSPTRSSGIRSSCSSPTRPRTRERASTGAAPRRATSRARVRELVDDGAATPGRDRAPVRGRHGRRVVRGGAARARAADLPRDGARATSASSRSSTCSCTCGCCATATTTRRSSTVLASPFVGVSNDALVLDPPPRRPPAALHRDRARRCRRRSSERGRAARPRVQAALRAARRGLGPRVARAAVRAGRVRARLRPRRARALGRRAPLREPAQADAARALVRGAARPRHRGLRPLHPRPGGARRGAARGRLGGGGRRRRPAAHDPRGEGARVQGRRRRGRRPRHRRPARRPTRSSRSPTAGFGFKVVHPATGEKHRRSSATKRSRGGHARPSGRSGCASTTSR